MRLAIAHTMSMRSIDGVLAPAKLNLFLHLAGRRADGYHLLQSAFTFIDWFDTLDFERNDHGRISRTDLTTALPGDDLCTRAARALQMASGTAFGVDIRIDKQIPSGAGMGGGSSDAASTLLALNRLWGLHWPLSALQTLGLQLGADVPFFVGGRTAWVEGIGEVLTPLDLPPQRYAVVKPPQGLSTAAIFGSPQLARPPEVDILVGLSDLVEAGRLTPDDVIAGYGCNALEPAARALCADVASAADWLVRRFGNARMTGSGSAVFARLEPGIEAPSDAFAELADGWCGRYCAGMSQHPLRGWEL